MVSAKGVAEVGVEEFDEGVGMVVGSSLDSVAGGGGTSDSLSVYGFNSVFTIVAVDDSMAVLSGSFESVVSCSASASISSFVFFA